MSPRIVLLLDGPPRPVPLGERGVTIGRAPDNDLVLVDETLSWRHAEVWARGGALYVRDRGSTNGTFVNGVRVTVPVSAVDGDELRFGLGVRARVEGATAPGSAPTTWLVEEPETGLRTPLAGGPWARAGELDLDDAGRPILAGDGGRVLAAGAEVTLRGVRLRLVEVPATPVATASPQSGLYPYRLGVRLDGPGGPEAVLVHRERAQSLVLTAENRVVVLYVLVRRLLADRARTPRGANLGWCPDEELAIGIWGRDGAGTPANSLHVLLHRLRKDIEAAGFDAGFLEKRRGASRLCLDDVTLGPLA